MTVDEDILRRVRNFAAVGHTPRQIACLLKIPPGQFDAFLEEFEWPETLVYQNYQLGKSMGYYNQNVELVKAAEKGDVFSIAKLEERIREKELDDLRHDLFGI